MFFKSRVSDEEMALKEKQELIEQFVLTLAEWGVLVYLYPPNQINILFRETEFFPKESLGKALRKIKLQRELKELED